MAAIVASRKATFGYALVDVTSIGQCGFHYSASAEPNYLRSSGPLPNSTIPRVASSAGDFPLDEEQELPVFFTPQ